MAARFFDKYKSEIVPVLETEFVQNKMKTAKIEKIVIGQRLGIFMANSKLISLLESNTDIPFDYSIDRRTAALCAAWKRICS